MKIESEKLMPYLPYSLKVIMEGKKTNVAWMSTKNIAVIRPDGIGDVKKIKWEYAHLNIKPVLIPLSDLKKQILYRDDYVYPIEVLGQSFIQDGFLIDDVFGWGQPTGGDDEQDYSLTIVKEDENLVFNIWCGNEFENGYVVEETPVNYEYMKILFEMNVDVFGLIDEGLAVSANELKKALAKN